MDTDQGIQLEFWLSSAEGPIHVIVEKQQALFFIKQCDISRAERLLTHIANLKIKKLQLKSFEFEWLAGIYFQSQQQLYRVRDILQKNGVACYESDIRPTERYLTERFITGPVMIHAERSIVAKNKPLYNPRLTSTDYYLPSLIVMSFDIETDYQNDTLFSISFVTQVHQLTLMLGEGNDTPTIEYLANQTVLMQRFFEWVKIIDPDIFIGWNVINFDLRFLQKKADQLNIPLELGRNNAQPIWRKIQSEVERYILLIPGRVVLDGIDTLKSATHNFRSFSLESVGSELLGRGKLIQAKNTADPLYKAKEIQRLFATNKPVLAAYNLEDCQLVWDIFKRTDLIDFAIERSRLTGLEMDRVGGSVAAFDNLYLPRLHRKGFVAPNIGDFAGSLSAPGGYVMASQPGLYDSVLVLDYKSLYPSIILTFKVDPYGRIAAQHLDKELIVPGFDGATFAKYDSILPEIIEELWEARDKAKRENKKALSQAIKIIMNSFYGVLGTPGCRLHDSRLTSSITKRSHEIILQTVKIIEAEGYRVIYGDTDSVFVSLDQSADNKHAGAIGKNLTKCINQYWQQQLQKDYAIESYLEMEFETHFSKFFMPTIRGSAQGSKKRYAGLIEDAAGNKRIAYKGLETVRTDWTELAREFQQGLYNRIFNNEAYEDFIRQTIGDLKAGKYNTQLVYRKRLRQKLKDYMKNIPPHAQAAIKAEEYFTQVGLPSRYKNASWIEYVITTNGAETLERQTSPLDYQHYIDKQLVPIAEAILHAIGASIESIIHNQIELF